MEDTFIWGMYEKWGRIIFTGINLMNTLITTYNLMGLAYRNGSEEQAISVISR